MEPKWGTHWTHGLVNMKAENGGEDWFVLREIHYYRNHSTGEVKLYGHTSVCLDGESPEEVAETLRVMLSDIQGAPTYDETEFKKGGE